MIKFIFKSFVLGSTASTAKRQMISTIYIKYLDTHIALSAVGAGCPMSDGFDSFLQKAFKGF